MKPFICSALSVALLFSTPVAGPARAAEGGKGQAGQKSTAGPADEEALAAADALYAAGEKRAFTFASPADEKEHKHTVTANVAAQRAEVAFDTSDFKGNHTLVQGSFAAAQLAEIRTVGALEEARMKWFAEHEAWFFEGE